MDKTNGQITTEIRRSGVDIDESIDSARLRALLSHSLESRGPASLETAGSHRVDISLDPPEK